MERVYAHLSKNGCRKSCFLADPDLTGTVLRIISLSTTDITALEAHCRMACDTAHTVKPIDQQNRRDGKKATAYPGKKAEKYVSNKHQL
jgi:hypothetical protein